MIGERHIWISTINYLLAYSGFQETGSSFSKVQAYLISVQSSHELESFVEVSNNSCWRDAIQEEINSQENIMKEIANVYLQSRYSLLCFLSFDWKEWT